MYTDVSPEVSDDHYFFSERGPKTRFPRTRASDSDAPGQPPLPVMSEWTEVTSKKKSSSVEKPSPPRPKSPPAMQVPHSATPIREEFSLPPGHRNFNPVKALRGLYRLCNRPTPLCCFTTSNPRSISVFRKTSPRKITFLDTTSHIIFLKDNSNTWHTHNVLHQERRFWVMD